uniref:Superoxide dismutase copper/zinc binding domain-containing protein n=1 Tax=Salarias fasciatus TaxID=181472 RepID=A0A672HHY2_SALFA
MQRIQNDWKESQCMIAVMNMNGIQGHISFVQASPFDLTELRVNLTNLRSRVAGYHVHHFPVPPLGASESSRCANDNLGGHWNPFGANVSSPTYPTGPGSTHDMYEIGDLSSKHGSLAGQNAVEMNFTDHSLPLFGNNSIVGRSVVIHLPDVSNDAKPFFSISSLWGRQPCVVSARTQ